MFRIFRSRENLASDALVHEVVDRTLAATERSVRDRAATMSPAELRGYVRARAEQIVRAEVQQMVDAREVSPALATVLIRTAMEHVACVVAHQPLIPPVVATPVVHVPLRAAA